jgi:hypothetical protein
MSIVYARINLKEIITETKLTHFMVEHALFVVLQCCFYKQSRHASTQVHILYNGMMRKDIFRGFFCLIYVIN